MTRKKETVLAQLEALSDFIRDNDDYAEIRKKGDLRLYMNKKVHDELTKECGHPVDIVKGVRLEVTEEELDHG